MQAETDLLASLQTPPKGAPPRKQPRRWPLVAGVLAILLALGVVGRAWLSDDSGVTWRTSEVARADLRQTVSVTGTLEAVNSVEVGTQVSGRIVELLADYNDEVEAGELLARIDPALLEAEVDSARASLAQRQAEAELARQELERARFLADREASSPQELQAAEAASAVAEAQVRSASVALQRAERNLGYAEIVSPIDGTVVDRLVEVGQTVNAGVSTPTLFSLVGDLEQMQILTTVDEADIGLLSAGQAVTFTVQAWPERTFEGSVRQVRLQSTTTDGVVTYTAVVDVDNHDRVLLPGMTAAVDLIVASVDSALTVPAAALRFKPSGGGARRGTGSRREPSATGAQDKTGGSGDALWTLDDGGGLKPVPVEVGISDGANTEVHGQGLSEGLVVVTGQVVSAGSSAGLSNPFKAEEQQRGRGPRGF